MSSACFSSAAEDEARRKKSLSVPTLGSSPVSVSWTNPTGSFLRTLLGPTAAAAASTAAAAVAGRRADMDLMEIEFGECSSHETTPTRTEKSHLGTR